jgi:hypothetical protein
LVGGLAAGISTGIVDGFWITNNGWNGDTENTSSVKRFISRIVVMFFAVFTSVVFAFIILSILTRHGGWIFAGLQLGILFGMCATLLLAFGERSRNLTLTTDILPVDRMHWDTQSGWQGAVLGSLFGLFAGSIASLFFGCSNPLVNPFCQQGYTSIDILIRLSIFASVLCGLIGFIFRARRGTRISGGKKSPYQAISLSLRNCLEMGFLISFSFSILGSLTIWFISGSSSDALTFASYGIFIGVLASLYYGGWLAIQHLTLCSLLSSAGFFPRPWRLLAFLEYAAQKIFLVQAGSSYMFIHEGMQDYFIKKLSKRPMGQVK